MTNPLVSIIVPIYNVEQYLYECIDSIVSQTYTNLEIILVDDGSLDKCPQICDEYKQKDNRIRVIHKKNGGLSDARNAGLDVATGEYISFIDGDDVISEKFIELLYRPFLQGEKIGISLCKFKPFYDGKYDSTFVENTSKNIGLELLLAQNSSLKTFLSMECNSACNKLYHRELFVNVRYPKGKIYEDVFVTYKILINAKDIYSTTSQLYFYRVRSGSIMGAKSFSLDYLNLIDAIHETIDWLKMNGYDQYVKYYYPALLMPEMYAWWGLKNVIKEKKFARKMLDKYRQDVKLSMPTAYFSKRKLLVFKLLGKMPFVYEFYRKMMPGKIGGR